MTWENGRELVSIKNSSDALIASYEYDASGLRISKTTTAGGNVYYVYDENSNLIFEKHPDFTLAFYYDGNGTRTHFTKKSSTGYETYYYRYNLQGDIIALLNNAGTVVAEYNYTAYGKPIGTITEIGNLNPFRYRGYYYDNETGFYYLQSRYYDPNTTRFINADAQFDEGVGILQYNLFLYCGNDPVDYADEEGNKRKPTIIRRYRFSVAILTTSQFSFDSNCMKNNLGRITSGSISISKITDGSPDSLKKAWNKVKNVDIVIINCHGLPGSINGMGTDGVSELKYKDIKLLVLLGCNNGHYEQAFKNIGYTFKQRISGKVLCSDGTVYLHNPFSSMYYSKGDKYWGEYNKSGRRRNYGWAVYSSVGVSFYIGNMIKISDIIPRLLK